MDGAGRDMKGTEQGDGWSRVGGGWDRTRGG